MNNEIEQLLIQLEYFIEENYKYYNNFELNKNQAKQLLDCITNLKQDNTMYAQLKDEYEEEIEDLKENNEVLLSSYKAQKDINHQQLSMVIKRDKKIKDLQQENKIKDTNWESLKYYLEKLYYKDYIEEAISDDIDKKIKELESKVEIKGYQKDIKALQQENERLKETNVYCNRTDCVGRIKDSKKYDSVYQEKEDYKLIIEKLTKELKTTYNKEYYYKYNGKYLKSEINTELLNLLESRGN